MFNEKKEKMLKGKTILDGLYVFNRAVHRYRLKNLTNNELTYKGNLMRKVRKNVATRPVITFVGEVIIE